jgi:hypothetical protein
MGCFTPNILVFIEMERKGGGVRVRRPFLFGLPAFSGSHRDSVRQRWGMICRVLG